MSIRTLSTITLALLMLVSAPLYGGNPGTPPRSPNQVASTYTAPTAEEAADMLFMREEEKLARDVYVAMSTKYPQNIFKNIAASEQKHFDALPVDEAVAIAPIALTASREQADRAVSHRLVKAGHHAVGVKPLVPRGQA